MFRLLPWPAPIGGNKVMAEEVKMLAPAGCAPGMNMNVNVNVNALSQSLPPLLKRKRSDSSVTDAPASTKPRPEPSVVAPTVSTPIPTVVPASNPVAAPVAPSPSSVTTAREPAPAPAASVRPDVNRLRETITAQLSLEVLLKHNELRLIDQEIAKCQVALEQLRRCAEIPYPGSAVSGVSADVSAGTGASVLLPGNGSAPISPAPWGVAEGPYSRHYARWLLPDHRFDGGEVETGSLAVRDGFMVPEGRSTRGNPMDFSSLAGKTRPSRGTPQAKFQSLSSGYPIPKEKPGPMLIRRKSDQVLVKLVCLDCRRDNFSSTQGFINHCRIAHNRNFASHDAAAMASGEPVEVDDAGTIIGGAAPRSESTSTVQATGLVHSLNRPTQLPTPSKESVTPQKPTLVKLPTAVATPPATVQPKPAPEPRHQSEPVKAMRNPSFLASPATPHLSALMRDRGLGLNMDKLVAEAKTPVDLSAFSDDDSDADESTSQAPSQQGTPVARQPMRMPTAQAALQRSEGRKGIDRGPHHMPDMTPSRPPYQQSFLGLSSLGSGPHHSLTDASRESDSLDHSANLSPNALESNQAPSLVSDDEDDYEAASDSDSPSSSEADEEEQEFRHIEVEDDERAGAPSAAAAEPKPGPSLTNPGPQAAPTLSNPLKQSRSKKMSKVGTFGDRRRDDQQVNFMHSGNEDAQLKRSNGQKPPPSNQ
jgi:ADA HAT complex component 1